MPIRKEVKETVTYPPSKRKAPPFKPQRPSKLARTATTDSEESENASRALETDSRATKAKDSSRAKSAPARKQSIPARKTVDSTVSNRKQPEPQIITNSDDDDDDLSSDDLANDLLPTIPPKPASKAQRIQPTGAASLDVISEDEHPLPTDDIPPDINTNATIPQPLLLRLMHEHFDAKDTKIDKHAVSVLQKYIDVFVRETIARAAMSKKDDVEDGRASQSDVDWLDQHDLEKVAGGMLMDF